MKVKYRVFSVILCCLMFFLVGCDGTTGVGDSGTPYIVQNVKVLRKPSEYEISDLVDGNSEYFYNIFAGETISRLFDIYHSFSNISNVIEEILEGISFPEEQRIYYDDSIRYTIQSIKTTTNDSGTSVTIVANLEGWKFGFKNYADGNSGTLLDAKNYIYSLALLSGVDAFDSLSTYNINSEQSTITITIPVDIYEDIYGSATDIFGLPGDYSEFYYGNEVLFADDATKVHYYSSPYYQQYVEGLSGDAVTALDDYQDALEYAVYMFVLGYDYENADGTENEEDAPFFDFEIKDETIQKDGLTIKAPKVYVGGWDISAVPIAEALQKAKDLYADLGVYVGLSDSNKEQVKRFILDKIIGVSKVNGVYDSSFDIKFIQENETGNISETTLELDRQYEQVVENIVNYACEQVLIGGAEGDGEVNIDEPFPISEIVDYGGNTFLCQRTDNSAVNEFGDLSLEYVPEAQYQCMSFELLPDQVGDDVTLQDIILAFQYYDTGTTDRDLKYLDEITINVGINYFDSSTNQLFQYDPTQITIEYTDVLTTGDDPDKNLLVMSASDLVAGYPGIVSMDPIPAKMSFDNNIDNGILNCSVNGVEIEEGVSVIKIDGASPARKYYKMNDSVTYGQYATFNESMFAGKTDYIEVYFDVVKEKGLENINYNFKVGLCELATNYWEM